MEWAAETAWWIEAASVSLILPRTITSFYLFRMNNKTLPLRKGQPLTFIYSTFTAHLQVISPHYIPFVERGPLLPSAHNTESRREIVQLIPGCPKGHQLRWHSLPRLFWSGTANSSSNNWDRLSRHNATRKGFLTISPDRHIFNEHCNS